MTTPPDLQDQAQGIITRAKAIITDPGNTWPTIAAETDAPMQVFTKWVLPLAAIGPIASFIGGQIFVYGAFGFSYRPSLTVGITTLLVGYVGALISVWLIAFIANFLSPKFDGKDDFPAAFRLTAYSMSAAWIVGIVGLIPALSILGLAGLYSLFLFYKGATIMMAVPEDKAIVYTVLTVVVGIVANVVIGIVSASITAPVAFASLPGA